MSTGSQSGATVHSLDVGQGDATLIEHSDGSRTLIDADKRHIVDALDEQLDPSRSASPSSPIHIHRFIATHLDLDHVAGLNYLKEAGYTIGEVYQPPEKRFEVDTGKGVSGGTIGDYKQALSELGFDFSQVKTLANGDRLNPGSDSLQILGPPNREGTVRKTRQTSEDVTLKDQQANENGVVIKLSDSVGNESLFLGDVQDKDNDHLGESWLLAEHGNTLNADTIHIGHHGSENATSDALLNAVNPSRAIISSDLTSAYGHPHDEVLERLHNHRIPVYWTGAQGTVIQDPDGDTNLYEMTAADVLAVKHYAKANGIYFSTLDNLKRNSIPKSDLPGGIPDITYRSKYVDTRSGSSNSSKRKRKNKNNGSNKIRKMDKDSNHAHSAFPSATSTDYVSVDEHATAADGPGTDSVGTRLDDAVEDCMDRIGEQRAVALSRLSTQPSTARSQSPPEATERDRSQADETTTRSSPDRTRK